MILVVGGMGFIGLNTALRFVEVGESIVITQHSAHRVPDLLKKEIGSRVFTARVDVTNPYEVFEVVRRHQVESIINLMAPPARSPIDMWDSVPRRAKLSRSTAASAGSSSRRAARTAAPS